MVEDLGSEARICSSGSYWPGGSWAPSCRDVRKTGNRYTGPGREKVLGEGQLRIILILSLPEARS